jgi:hypothetical protein
MAARFVDARHTLDEAVTCVQVPNDFIKDGADLLYHPLIRFVFWIDRTANASNAFY